MRTVERIKRNMHSERRMKMISIRLPEHVLEDLKDMAPKLGFGGYQALIRAFISGGLRKHFAEQEAEHARNSAVEEFSHRLAAHGVSEEAIRQASAEMQAGSGLG